MHAPAASRPNTRADDLMSPRGKRTARYDPIAPRLADIRGKRIGLLDNAKSNADILLDEVGKILLRDHGVAAVMLRKKPETARPASQYGFVDELAEGVDAVVNAYGDCGSCTSWAIHDSVDLERRGIPTATINTDEFASLGQFDAIAKGLPGLPIVTVPHPVGDNLDREIRQKARDAVAGIVAVLVGAREEIEQDYTNRYILRANANRKEHLFCAL